jgi:hypothetical protein
MVGSVGAAPLDGAGRAGACVDAHAPRRATAKKYAGNQGERMWREC